MYTLDAALFAFCVSASMDFVSVCKPWQWYSCWLDNSGGLVLCAVEAPSVGTQGLKQEEDV